MRTVLEVEGLFDGTRTMSDAAVVIEEGTITWVGKRSRAPKTPKGERSRTLETGGRFLPPGLINCHAHLTFDGSADFASESRQEPALGTLKAFRNARALLRAGVTTVRDLGANGTMVIELARAIEGGIVEGPRIVAAGRGLTSTGGHGREIGRVADGVDEMRKAAREQVAAGASVIKIFSTGGVVGEGAGPEVSQYSVEETRAAVEEAHRFGLRATTHAHGAAGMRVAAEAGIDSIEHSTPFNRHERYALELVYLTEAGLTREEALVSATSGAAEVIGRPNAGRIGEGSCADFVFVDGDPLKDLETLTKPKAVWIRGAPAAF